MDEQSIAIVGHDSSAHNVVCDYRMSRRGLAWEAPQVRKHGIARQHIIPTTNIRTGTGSFATHTRERTT